MVTGLAVAGSGGIVVGALVVANVIGFPEVEGGEALVLEILGGAGGDVVASGGFIGGMWGRWSRNDGNPPDQGSDVTRPRPPRNY
jgi:hypothetical protein